MPTSIEQTRVAAIYNPQTQTKTQLIEGFVVRQQLFKNLFKAIKEAKMEVPEQHYLLRGRRGMGKTTLLLRLAYEVENDPALNTWLIPLVFNEEEYGIRRLFNFWERILELLEQQHPDFRFEEAERHQLSTQYKDDDDYERALFERLSNELQRFGKKLILFIDNFGDMARKMTDAEAHRLRKILQTSSDLRIMAASAVVLEAFYRYDHPFYEFFKVVELKGLDKNETRELLLRLSEHYKKESVVRIVEQHPGRVEALRRITGGVIRSVVLLFEIFADDDDGSAFKDLEIVLDRVTPLYKHRMDDLSDQHQAIVEAIALNWDALNVKEIAKRTRLESKFISAQLQYLEKNGIVQKIPTKTKNHLYQIAERFFNIWYLMRNGRRGDEKRVRWLVRFFEEWCDGDMMKTRATGHRSALRKGGFDPEAAFTYTQALAQTQQLGLSDRHELLRDTRNYLLETAAELAKDLQDSDLELAYQGLKTWFEGQRTEALAILDKIGDKVLEGAKLEAFLKARKFIETAQFWEDEITGFAVKIGAIFYKLSMPELKYAENCWLFAVEVRNAPAMSWLGWISEKEKKDLDKALDWYHKAAMAGDAWAMNRLGVIFKNEKKDIEKAIEWYEKAIEAGNSGAMNSLGLIFQNEKKDIEKALEWYKKAAAVGYADAMYNLGWIFQNEKKDIEKAIEWYEKAAAAGSTGAMYNLGAVFLSEKKDLNKAVEWYEKAATAGNLLGMVIFSYYLFYEKKQKKQALHLAIKYLEETLNEHEFDLFRLYAAGIFIWNNHLQESKSLTLPLLQNLSFIEKYPDEITTCLLLLLAKGEAPWLLDLFNSPEGEAAQLKDRFKPIYYAILKKLDHPDFLRMGEELAQTVDEILARAKEMAVAYA